MHVGLCAHGIGQFGGCVGLSVCRDALRFRFCGRVGGLVLDGCVGGFGTCGVLTGRCVDVREGVCVCAWMLVCVCGRSGYAWI